MKKSILKMMHHRHRPARRVMNSLMFSAVCATILMSGPAQSQAIYRIVGSDGRVTFSDKLPAAAENASVLVPGGRSITPAAVSLPQALREVAGKYPVTLYTSSSCAPCNSGREMLSMRGIPFSEKTVSTAEDSDALQRISGSGLLPLLTIGGQQIKGFSESEWTQYLDFAGYPKTSLLPATYRAPPATPLVSPEKAAPPPQPVQAQPPNVQPEPSVAPANPAGIRF